MASKKTTSRSNGKSSMPKPQTQQAKEVTFVFGAMPEAACVYLAGEFNNWRPDAQPMEKQRDGTFKARVRLKPGQHQYKFVADGAWINDAAAEQVPNPFGSLNSVVRVE